MHKARRSGLAGRGGKGHVVRMETLSAVEVAGAVMLGNALSVMVAYVYWKAAKDQFKARDSLALVLPLVFLAAAFYH